MSLQQQGIPTVRTGNQMVAFMKGQDVSKYFNGYLDNASLRSWYEEDPVNNHKGLVSFWNQQDRVERPMGLFDELLESKSVIEVNGQEGTFTYDVPIKQKRGIYTEMDMSTQDVPGIDGSIFYIVLNKEFSPNTVLDNDNFEAQQIIVSPDEPVMPTGTGYKHPVTLLTQNKSAYFDPSQLGRGIEYFVISHGTPEYGTEFAKVEMPDTPGSMKFEFRLGSVMGVESYVTAKADSVSMEDGVTSAKTSQYKNAIQKEMDSKGYGEYVTRMDIGADGKPMPSTVNVGSTLEYLTEKYLHKLIGTKLMFQNAGEVRTQNGVLRFNEGLWKQARRGRIIEYGRPGGITKQHIREATEYVFRTKPDMQFENRRVKFKCGMQAYYNVLELFEDEVRAQVANIAPFLGSDRTINNPVSGDNKNLELGAVRFTKVYIPQIGMVEIEHDPSLDYGLKGDRFQQGMHPHGMSHTTHTMVIWDVTDNSYSNNSSEIPNGANLVEGGNFNSNMFLVKPANQPLIHSGKSVGRYDSTTSRDVRAAHKYMGEEYFAWCAGLDVWMPDPTKIVMIELKPSKRKGFQ